MIQEVMPSGSCTSKGWYHTMVPNSDSPLLASPSSLSLTVTHSLNGTACCEMGGKCAKRSQCGASKGRKGVTSSECLGRNVFWCQDHQITNEEVGMSGAQLVIHGYPLWFFKQSAGMINIWCSNRNHKKWISTKSWTRSHSWLQYQHSPTIRTASSTLLTKWRHPIRIVSLSLSLYRTEKRLPMMMLPYH